MRLLPPSPFPSPPTVPAEPFYVLSCLYKLSIWFGLAKYRQRERKRVCAGFKLFKILEDWQLLLIKTQHLRKENASHCVSPASI